MAELNGKYLNEQNYTKVKTKLKKIGKILLVCGFILFLAGIALIVVGVINFSKFDVKLDPMNPTMPHSFGGVGYFIGGGILSFIGFGMIGFSIYAIFFAHAREIAAFGKSATAPIIGETINYMADETSPAIEKMASSIAKGVKESGSAQTNSSKSGKFCTHCGAKNDKSAKFCINCGEKFE